MSSLLRAAARWGPTPTPTGAGITGRAFARDGYVHVKWLAALGAVVVLSGALWLSGLRSRTVETHNEWANLGLHLSLPDDFVYRPRAASPPVSEGATPAWWPVSPDALRAHFERARAPDQSTPARAAPPYIEVTIDERPEYGNLAAALALVQRLTIGPSYQQLRADIALVSGRSWLRTEYCYDAPSEYFVSSKIGVVEYALIRENKLYRVGFHGWDGEKNAQIGRLMREIRMTSRDEATALMEPGDARTTVEQDDIVPRPVTEGAASVLLIVAGTLEGTTLRVRSGGSGTPVSQDGAILSNLHVILDEERGELYEVFFVGRHTGDSGALEFLCAGRPANGSFREDVDLALLRCDQDMLNRAPSSRFWRSVAHVQTHKPEPGSRVFVVGYPDSGAGRLTINVGTVTGWDENVSSSVGYLQTDAGISAGVSGGAVFSATGELLGVPSAYRFRAHWRDPQSRVQLERVGLILPIARAQTLLDLAANGWAIERTSRTP